MTRRAESIYADGRWVPSATTERFLIHNPADDAVIGQITLGCGADVDLAVSAAKRAHALWDATSLEERIALLMRVQALIRDRAETLAETITSEMGTPLAFSRAAQIGLAIGGIGAAIAGAKEVAFEETIGSSLVRREGVGVVGAITPWNFPLHQITAKVAPALLAGCTVVLKPSEVTPLDAVMMAEIFDHAGAPAGVFNLVLGGRDVGALLVQHPDVDMISFTGSTLGGRSVAEAAGRSGKRVSLELGGKSANIVLEDADFSAMAPQALGQCFINSGQVCAALSRLLVPQTRLAEVEELLAEAAKGWPVGDPRDPSTRLGPVASRRQQASVLAAIRNALSNGARAVAGGAEAPIATGAYVAPTILAEVSRTMDIARHETFGPVLSLIGYATEDEAIEIANDSEYGLSGGVWSADAQRALSVARRMRTGQVVINGASLDLAAPFGGVKASGYGRENGRFGVEEFLTAKAITSRPLA